MISWYMPINREVVEQRTLLDAMAPSSPAFAPFTSDFFHFLSVSDFTTDCFYHGLLVNDDPIS